MAQKKPDRFERIVGKIVQEANYKPDMYRDDVVKLLRREHRWMAKMIKTMEKPPGEVADFLSRRGILDKLTRRAL